MNALDRAAGASDYRRAIEVARGASQQARDTLILCTYPTRGVPVKMPAGDVIGKVAAAGGGLYKC